jgi:hypothetical protein
MDKAKPILFSGPMVQAILEGRKTMTRRTMKPQPELQSNGLWHVFNRHGGTAGVASDAVGVCAVDYLPIFEGDRLWVREGLKRGANGEVIYAADGTVYPDAEWVWKNSAVPSIHCPRGLSRITLEVTGVKVERLQDISEADAKAEGIFYKPPTADDLAWYASHCEEEGLDPSVPMDGVWHSGAQGDNMWGPTPKFAFRQLWQSLNGPDSWARNDWVAAYSFRLANQHRERA